MTGKTRLTTAPSELTHCSRDDTHTPPTLRLSSCCFGPHTMRAVHLRRNLSFSWGSGPSGSLGLTYYRMAAAAPALESPKTASGMALAIASARLRIPTTSPGPVPGAAPAPHPGPPAHWLGWSAGCCHCTSVWCCWSPGAGAQRTPGSDTCLRDRRTWRGTGTDFSCTELLPEAAARLNPQPDGETEKRKGGGRD